MHVIHTLRRHATAGDRRRRPSCYLCRTHQDLLIVGIHTLPPGKWGGARGVKRLGLCRYCALAFAREVSSDAGAVPAPDHATLRVVGDDDA